MRPPSLPRLWGWPSFFVADSPDGATLFLGGEDDVVAALLAAFAFVPALIGWPSCFAVDSSAVLAALSGGLACYAALSGFFRRLVFGAARAVAAIFSDGCRGFVSVASWICFESFPGGLPLGTDVFDIPGGGSQEGSGRARAHALCVRIWGGGRACGRWRS